MKQLLMTLSTLTTLTLTSNSIINTIDVANTTVNKLLTNKLSISDSVTSLFNNQYGYLSSSDWITNQIDNNYYSYDTSHANYLLSDGKTSARTLFTVDNKGELVYKKDAVIPPKDKVEVDATKQEMITHKKNTTVKDKGWLSKIRNKLNLYSLIIFQTRNNLDFYEIVHSSYYFLKDISTKILILNFIKC
ncbi:hypothetical protein [Spiroplasma endosymbiont of Monopis laevigella]|uniref:hypothetical protein n=1 Tax=Spiroplasma endosymbiont of Monopis laevigella TaxID=3066312 RepID=UPI0030D55B03